jgi:poly(beta-D-mannuronate) lyase
MKLARSLFGLGLCLISPGIILAKTTEVIDEAQLYKALQQASPGDEVLLRAGEWKDVELRVEGQGKPDAPIIVRAAQPGRTVLTGKSRVRIAGEHLVLDGICLHNITGLNTDWLEYRYDSKKLANNCIVRNCRLSEDENFKPEEGESRWIGIYGQGNRLEHCLIEGKRNRGATVVVWLGEKSLGEHVIQANHFGKRPRLGKNGGETLRIGDSKTRLQSARCLVESNRFERCDGETECVSNKSSDNIYRSNSFVEVQGTLTLRHGDRCLVEQNIFLGNMRSQTGGIRVIGEGHRVVGNYLEGLEGDGFQTGIVVLRGDPNALENGYHPVWDAVIEENVIVDCQHSVLLAYNDDPKASVLPSTTVFRGQKIIARSKLPPIEFETIGQPIFELPNGIEMRENLVKPKFSRFRLSKV